MHSPRDPATVAVVPGKPVFDVPQAGPSSSATASGFWINTMVGADGTTPSPRVRLNWSDQDLLVEIHVADTTPHEVSTNLYAGDSVELFVSRGDDPKQFYQAVIAPGIDPTFPEPRQAFYDHRTLKQPNALKVSCQREKVAGGYVLQVALPWSNLDLKGQPGQTVGFQVFVNDADASGDLHHTVWFPSALTPLKPTDMFTLRLGSIASEPVVAAITGEYQQFRRTKIMAVATPELAGQVVGVYEQSKLLGTGVLRKRNSGSVAQIILPMPQRGKAYGPLDIRTSDRRLGTLTMPSPEGEYAQNREEVVRKARFRFRSCVFSGEVFPKGQFEDPSLVEDAIGPYTVNIRYFDADYREVTKAARPGRYGAVAEITSESGKTTKRYATLYRQSEPIKSWRDVTLSLTTDLPRELGVEAAVAREQSETVGNHFKWMLVDSMERDDTVAILLAGLSETTPGSGKAVSRTNVWARTYDWWFGLKQRLGEDKYKYLVHLPADYGKTPGRKYPLILLLHGWGQRGDDLYQQFKSSQKEIDAITLVPQCRVEEYWSARELEAVLKEVVAKYPVDEDRVYAAGVSMGGYGTWALAMAYPQLLAAVVPVCGIGDKDDVARVKDLPMWVFHGDADDIVPFKPDAEAVAALQKIGGRVRFTVYPGGGHDVWSPTWKNPRVWQWLLEQKRGEPREPSGGTSGAATMPTASNE